MHICIPCVIRLRLEVGGFAVAGQLADLLLCLAAAPSPTPS